MRYCIKGKEHTAVWFDTDLDCDIVEKDRNVIIQFWKFDYDYERVNIRFSHAVKRKDFHMMIIDNKALIDTWDDIETIRDKLIEAGIEVE